MRRVSSASPSFGEAGLQSILKDVEATLRSGVLTDGVHVKSFEKEFAEYVGVKHAITVNSGTSALEIALRHYKLEGKEVVVPTNTFVATPNSVIFAGGKPVFADIRENTLCIDPEDVRKRMTPKTAGVVVVHIAGLICPQITELKEMCEDRGLFLIEDAAHAHGATIDKKKAGSIGEAGCFSFYPTKVMTTGEGGMITTDSESLAESAVRMRTHGLDRNRLMVSLGHNWRMSEVAAIMGRHQLTGLEEFLERRNEIAEYYKNSLRDVEGISLFKTPSNIRHSYYKFPVRLADRVDAEELGLALRSDYNIETGNVYYPPCHLHPFYRERFKTKEGDLPVSESVLKKVLCLPMHAALAKADAETVSRALHELL